MTLSQQLREAGEKATPGAWEISVASFDDETGDVQYTLSGVKHIRRADPHLIVLLRNNLDTIIAALEAQEAGK
jgi:hypothetical protein